MRRREFMTLLGGVAAAWPLSVRAQQQAVPVVGFLHSASPNTWGPFVSAFRTGLKEVGFIEGQNVNVEYRWAENQIDRLPALANDLVRRGVNVIVSNTEGSLAAKAATGTIPIVFTTGADPVKMGLVPSLSHPGSNITGVKWFSSEVTGKNLEFLHDLVPHTKAFGFLVDPTFRGSIEQLKDIQDDARSLGVELDILSASTKEEIENQIKKFAHQQGNALVVGPGPFFTSQRDAMIQFVAQYALPTIYTERETAVDGGLMSYGSNPLEAYRELGVYAGRILKGEKPAEMPVEQSTKFQLVINLKTAKALGISVPPPLLLLADEVIE
jgi:putative tryptophan/tyrosine transport system substrate-binding protein